MAFNDGLKGFGAWVAYCEWCFVWVILFAQGLCTICSLGEYMYDLYDLFKLPLARNGSSEVSNPSE